MLIVILANGMTCIYNRSCSSESVEGENLLAITMATGGKESMDAYIDHQHQDVDVENTWCDLAQLLTRHSEHRKYLSRSKLDSIPCSTCEGIRKAWNMSASVSLDFQRKGKVYTKHGEVHQYSHTTSFQI